MEAFAACYPEAEGQKLQDVLSQTTAAVVHYSASICAIFALNLVLVL